MKLLRFLVLSGVNTKKIMKDAMQELFQRVSENLTNSVNDQFGSVCFAVLWSQQSEYDVTLT